jgi:quinol monooxygenase YgiN
MSVLVLLEPEAADGKIDELIAVFNAVLPDTRAFDGCEGVTVHRDQDAPNKLVLVERWASRPHYERYFQWRLDRGDIEKLGALAAGPPVIRYFDEVE